MTASISSWFVRRRLLLNVSIGTKGTSSGSREKTRSEQGTRYHRAPQRGGRPRLPRGPAPG